MIFSSTLFLFLFLPANLLLYYLVPARFLAVRNMLLLCGSLVFYAWGEPHVIAVMLFSIAVNYLFGLLMGKYRCKTLLAGAVGFNLGLLGYFKYANFFVDNVNALFGTAYVSEIALPIGISFFTFQIMSYVIDVYRENVQIQRNPFYLALYILFFPQLIAGPIVRYIDIEEQLHKRNHSWDTAASGFRRFVMGLSKKVLIANQVAVFADYAFNAPSPSASAAWAGVICYALQIYFDFSGYSDMAIGLGRMFGFEFLENFNHPYISVSVQDFWRRWHISLSSWFRDYLYIPLGGNRKGEVRTYANLMIVFLATGFWHGASWSFVVWGVYHGVFLMLERGVLGRLLKKLPKAVSWLYTMAVVLIGWVIFRASTLPEAAAYLRRMFGFGSIGFSQTLANMNIFILLALAAGIIFSIPIKMRRTYAWVSVTGCIFMLALSIVFLTGSDFNPFLYFRF